MGVGFFFLVHRHHFVVDVVDGDAAQEDVEDVEVAAESHVDEGGDADALQDAVDGVAFFAVLHFMAQRKGQLVVAQGVHHALVDGNDAADGFKGVQVLRRVGVYVVLAFDHARGYDVALNPFQTVAVGFAGDDARLGLGAGQHLLLRAVVHFRQLLLGQGHGGGPVGQGLPPRRGHSRADGDGEQGQAQEACRQGFLPMYHVIPSPLAGTGRGLLFLPGASA